MVCGGWERDARGSISKGEKRGEAVGKVSNQNSRQNKARTSGIKKRKKVVRRKLLCDE